MAPGSSHDAGPAEAALRAGDLAGAMRLGAAAVAAGAEHPTLLLLAGLKRMNSGDHAGALPLLERARALAPAHPGVLDGLGQCLTRLDRPAEALAAFDAALAVLPDDPQLHFNRAMALEDTGALDAARAELERTIELRPRHGDALARLAILAAQRGDVRAGRAAALGALAIDPRDVVARLALAMSEVESRDFAAAEIQIHALLREPKLSAVNMAFVHSLAGDILDGQDRPAEAFNAYAAAKATLREAYAPVFASRESVTARELRLAAYLRARQPVPAVPPAAPQRRHVFLVGFPRSGTTLLEHVLSSHPDVEAMEEQPCLVDAALEFTGSDAAMDRFAALSDAGLEPWRQAYWRRAAQAGHQGACPVFLDKLPLNLPFLPLIARLFPQAKILLALRDPRDVVLSCFRRRFGMNLGMYEFTSLQTTAAYYDAVMALMQVCAQKLPLEICQTRHEALIEDFDGEVRRLCAFLGLGFCEEMRNFAARAAARNIDTPSNAQVARGLNRAGAGQWRRYRAPLAPVLPILAPWVAHFGYPL
jgi:tetratricopeptide (TPR) repeat protein